MSKHDRNTGNVVPLPSHETPNRKHDLRHVLETDRMRLPDDTFSAIEQVLRELHWLLQMAKAESKAE
jgi:hypothetical protein